MNLRVRGAT